jgi:hypothetical protein
MRGVGVEVSGGRTMSSLLVLFALAVVSCSDTGELQDEVNRQAEQIEELTVAVRANTTDIGLLAEATSEIVEGLDEVDLPLNLSAEVASIRRDLDDAIVATQDAFDRAEDIAACVNEYMDTIGRWSSDVYSFYDYYYC